MTLFRNRRSHSLSFIPGLMTIMLTALMWWMINRLFNNAVPVDNKDVLLVILGAVVIVWKDYAGFWIISSRSSQEKDKLLANSIPANSRRENDPDPQ